VSTQIELNPLLLPAPSPNQPTTHHHNNNHQPVIATAAAAAVIAVATAVVLSAGKGKGRQPAARGVRGGGSRRASRAAADADDDAASSTPPLSARSTRSVGAAAKAAATAAAAAAAAAAGGDAPAASTAAAATPKPTPTPTPARRRGAATASDPPSAPKPTPTDAELDAALCGNARLLSPEQLAMARLLIEEDQAHLFKAWGSPAAADAQPTSAEPTATSTTTNKRRLLDQALRLDRDYAHGGGLRGYLRNARRLLAESRRGSNPFDGYEPSVPRDGARVDYASPRFLELEARGAEAARDAAFVLVAGGLGERLGYSGLKVALPTQMTTGACFLETYVRWILALQRLSGAERPLPLAIMTSDDTHQRTHDLLATHHHFGASPEQITLLKQEKVACLSDSDAHLALDPSDAFAIQTKPHGHGDVHSLLHSSGLARRWRDQSGVKWVCFFQDTNALVFRAMVPALGLSAEKGLDVNSVAVPRRAKEAIGAIATLTWRGKGGKRSSGGGGGGAAAAAAAAAANGGGSGGGGGLPTTPLAGSSNGGDGGGSGLDAPPKSKTRRGRRGGRRHNKKPNNAAVAAAAGSELPPLDGPDAATPPPPTPTPTPAANPASRRRLRMTCNVEYNLLDPLLRATVAPDTGDANDPATGLSPYPGNINQLVIKLESYCSVLQRTGGVISEFVNPKYADLQERKAFKSSTRLECMMQDYPRSLPEGASVGFTVVNQVWAAYSPVKNGLEAAAAKAGAGEPTHSAAAAEFDLYKSSCRALMLAGGCDIADGGGGSGGGGAGAAKKEVFGGVPVEADWPRVALSPEFAPTLGELRRRLGGQQRGGGAGSSGSSSGGGGGGGLHPPIRLSARSVLVLDGAGIEVRGPVDVDGALVVRAAPGARVVIGPLRVRNRGWAWRALPPAGGGGGGGGDNESVREEDAMRGFVVDRHETTEYVFDRPGEYVVVGGDGGEGDGEKGRRGVTERVLVAA
jgi:hypothetical protein